MIRLTVREWQTLRAISFGWSQKHLADHLGRSRSTIAKHADKVFAKLGASKQGGRHRGHTANGHVVRLGYEHGFLANGDLPVVRDPLQEGHLQGDRAESRTHPAECFQAGRCGCDQ